MSSAKATEKSTEARKTESSGAPRRDGTRETIESIVIAFIFAFLFRTFEAEAFVIPTGSMAPTLMGRHKDEICPSCGFEFTVGTSEEINQETQLFKGSRHRFNTAICPNCHYITEIRDDPVFAGDRILVTKFNYKIADPKRWDVTVFKYPEDPSTNYIKRLCGLPGETIEVRQGDLYRIDQGGGVEILRKQTGEKQVAVLQSVYDDDKPPGQLVEAGWPERWAPLAHDDGPEAVAGWSIEVDGWQPDPAARSYQIAPDGESHWLRYRHFVPTTEDWESFAAGRPLEPEARLILDFLAYDTGVSPASRFFGKGVYWVGDLSVAATLDIETIEPNAEIVLELYEGDRRYRCTIDPIAGEARIAYADAMDPAWDKADAQFQLLSKAPVELTEPDEYEIRFANIDNRLWLIIDGDEVEFPAPAYKPAVGQMIQLPTENDLTPIGISARNVGMTVSHLRVERDIYYRAEIINPAMAQTHPDRPSVLHEVGTETVELRLHDLADRPKEYGDLYYDSVAWFDDLSRRLRWLPLGEDEFLLLGDNSPRSSDGRLWSNHRGAEHRHAVPREALVGKALLVFWPHGLRLGNVENGQPQGWTIPFLDSFFYHKQLTVEPNGQQHIELVEDYPKHGVPFYPNFERILRRIR